MIMTDHEAQQREEVSKPLWPIYATWPHCTGGSCLQGHAICMTPEACQTGLPDDEEFAPKPPMTGADVMWLLTLVLACFGAAVGVAMIFGVRL